MNYSLNESSGYGFDNFVAELSLIVDQGLNDDERVIKVESLVKKLIRGGYSWLTSEHQQPSDRQYARHSLHRDSFDRFEILALVWKPGQATAVHDHDGTWGVEAVLKGQMEVTNYLVVKQNSDNTVKLALTGAFSIGRMSTGRLLPPADCHLLKAEGDEIAITLHVYGKQLRKFKVFEPLHEDALYKVCDYYVENDSAH